MKSGQVRKCSGGFILEMMNEDYESQEFVFTTLEEAMAEFKKQMEGNKKETSEGIQTENKKQLLND